MLRRVFLLLAVLVWVGAEEAYAINHKNLDENRPLRVEDAYPIATGEIAIEVGGGLTLQRHGESRGVFPIEILCGALPNLQLGVGTTLLTDPSEIDGVKSGDLKLSGLYNFKLALNLPTGVASSGADVELKAIVTKSFNRLSFHFNAAYEFLDGTRADERNGRYQFVLGASYPIGAPKYTRTTLIADLFIEQTSQRGKPDTFGAEIGFRHQLTPRVVGYSSVVLDRMHDEGAYRSVRDETVLE
jgi:hypothetical protein